MSTIDDMTYQLNTADSNLLAIVQRNQQATFAVILSHFALTRDYKVTDRTQFKLSDNFTELTVSELVEDFTPKDKGGSAVVESK